MAAFEEYAERYRTIRMERRDGILQLTFHTDGGPLQWGELPHSEFPRAFSDIGGDPENRVVIMTGTGDAFSVHRLRRTRGSGESPASGTRSTGTASTSCKTCSTSRSR